MTISPLRLRPRPSTLRPAALLVLLALGACNAIFGIEPGLPGGTTGTGNPGVGGAGGTTGSGGATGGTTGSSGSAGGTTGSGGATGGTTGSGSTCSPTPNPVKETPRKLLVSTSDGYDQCNAVVHDAQDKLIAAGYFAGASVELGTSITHVGAAGVQNGFVVKQDASGAALWGRAFGGTEDLRLNGAGVDAAGNIYVTGTFGGMATSGGIDLIASHDGAQSPDSQPDALVIALSPANTVLWSKHFGNGLAQRGHRIAVDAAGNTYVAGTSMGKVDFGDGNGAIGDASGWWSFFLKLDPTGKPLWARSIEGFRPKLSPDPDEVFEIALTLDDKGHVIIGGTFQGKVFFGVDAETAVGEADAFVASLDVADGKMLWHRTFHRPKGGPDPDGNQWITALTVEPCSGDVYAAGGFTEGINFESLGGAKVNHGKTSDQDMFLAKLAAGDGAPIWFNAYGDSGIQEPTALKVAPDGAVLFTGFLINGDNPQGLYCGPVIDYLPPVAGDTGPNSDIFLLKLDSLGKGIWGRRFGDIQPQTAFDIASDSNGGIALGGLTSGMLALGGSTVAQSSNTIDVFLAHFDP